MTVLQTADGLTTLQDFIRTMGGESKEWYVGVSNNAQSRLEQHGMAGHHHALLIQCEDEASALEIKNLLLQQGLQDDGGAGNAKKPATQVYLFRAPKLTRFREWLKDQERKEGVEGRQREAKRNEWVEAIARMIERCEGWLAAVDRHGILSLERTTGEIAEAGLGRYEAPRLTVEHQESRVRIAPFARNTRRALPLNSEKEVPTSGRIDITNGAEKETLYRTGEGESERWYLVSENGTPVDFNEDVFMAIMEDLLS